ncbi:dTMP kinase [Piscinibacter sakaiensis]|uniref:dTMP kinase n=1 Tax=Piscinibacter sakaiensis TaxID=1547922 RepID=UPI003AAEBC1C
MIRSIEGGAPQRGRFITVEGIDGAGKSTHVDALVERLRSAGAGVLATREPGGTPLAESLRELLLERPMDALSETLLVFAARRDHLQQQIAPALARGETVVCDRFTDATFAYQGGGRGFDRAILGQLEQWVHGELQPDLTLWFDLPAEMAAARRAAARSPDRFEQQDLDFFARVRAAYAERCAAAPQRFVRIDATPERAAVWQQIDAALVQRGW